MSDRCQAADGYKQCRATTKLERIYMRVPDDLDLVKTVQVLVNLCPKHFVIPKEAQ